MITIDGYRIDVALSEDHSFDSDVTDFPVERGGDITDNVRVKPIVVTLDGLISDAPLGDLVQLRQREGSFIGSAPSNDAFAKLLEIRDARQPVTIETSLQVFKDMMLKSLSVPRDAKTGKALRFRATFQQIRFVTNVFQRVRVAVPRAQPKVDQGPKSGKDAPKLIDFAGGKYTKEQIDSGEAATDAVTKFMAANPPGELGETIPGIRESASTSSQTFSHEDPRNPCDLEFLKNQKQGRDITDQQACREIVVGHGQPYPESF